MRIVSHKKLRDFFSRPGYQDAKKPLEIWYDIAKRADWHSFADIKDDFNSVDSIGKQRYVFNIKGNHYRIVAVVQFMHGTMYIRFVGTHSEYDKIDCLTI